MGSESRIALTRLRSTLILTFTTALLVALFAPSPAFAASQSLSLPQGDASAILRHWLGPKTPRFFGPFAPAVVIAFQMNQSPSLKP